MTTITLAGIREILKDDATVFVRQGRGGKAVHLSLGADIKHYGIKCGDFNRATERRASRLYPLHYTEIDNADMCKKCLKILQLAVTPMVGA